MPDGYVTLRQGEKRPVYGQETLSSGTMTIASSPTPAATLYNSNGAGVIGFIGLPATGYDSGAQAAPRIWLLLDTASLSPGFYTLVFSFTAAASDSTTRIYEPAIEIQVLAVQG